MRRRRLILFASAGMLLVTAGGLRLVGRAHAQSGSRSGSYPAPATSPPASQYRRTAPAATPAPVVTRPFEERFWQVLQDSQYRNWAPMPGKSGDAFAGQSPHGDMVKLYANRTAATKPDAPPAGSILVKENYGPDGKTLMAVTVMYRSNGYDPGNADWYWAKYEPGGAVSRMNGMAVAGKVQMCAECHAGAAGGDFVFSNDR